MAEGNTERQNKTKDPEFPLHRGLLFFNRLLFLVYLFLIVFQSGITAQPGLYTDIRQIESHVSRPIFPVCGCRAANGWCFTPRTWHFFSSGRITWLRYRTYAMLVPFVCPLSRLRERKERQEPLSRLELNTRPSPAFTRDASDAER